MTARHFVGTLLSLFVLFLAPVIAQAETEWVELPDASDVEPDKTWTIEFNTSINEATVKDNISVRTLNNGQYTPSFDVSADGKKITIHPPKDGYNSEEYYQLSVKKEISSAQGKEMEKGYKKKFRIKQYEEKPQTKPDPEEPEEPEEKPIEEKEILSTGTVTAGSLNVRSGPSANYERMGSISRGEKVKVYDFDGFWAEIEYGGKTGYVHKTYMKLRKEGGTAIEGQRVVIDAGHGDHDPGAQDRGTQEKEINLDVSQRVAERLKELGATPIMTRDSDKFVTLQGRVDYAQEVNGDLFVSIHTNAAYRSAKGSEVFYDTRKLSNVEEGRILAEKIQRQLVDVVDMYDRGVKDNNWHVIHYNTLPSVLVELGFVTNSEDYEKLTSDHYRDLYAQAITQGIVDYYEEEVN